MRPDKLAEHLGEIICTVVAPLQRQLAELRTQNEELKRLVAALEAQHARQSAAVAGLQKNLIDTSQAVQVLEAHRTTPRIDMHAGDPRH
jgi:peptidoglycan hydrolase CwlO-like protein